MGYRYTKEREEEGIEIDEGIHFRHFSFVKYSMV